jgi:magnesium chelatase subunit H
MAAARTTPRSRDAAPVPLRVTVVTMDGHLASTAARVRSTLAHEAPGLELTLHAAADYAGNDAALARCRADIARADIVLVAMLFMEDHFLPVLEALRERREHCDAMVCVLSASEATQLTRMGKLDMARPASGPLALLKRLRGQRAKDGPPTQGGATQMKMLRRLPQLLRFIPGTAQDLRVWFLAMQYWLGGSDTNLANLVRLLIERYAAGAREAWRQRMRVGAPEAYPEVGVYHPRLGGSGPAPASARLSEDASALPGVVPAAQRRGRVGLLLMRSYLLAGNTRHYDGAIAALEVQGLEVVPAFASGLDARPAIERYFMRDGRSTVDAVISLTGFSLVGGPAYHDAPAAEQTLTALDVPYVAAQPLEFQTLDQWGGSERGLMPVESTIMVAIPELDGAIAPGVFGGRGGGKQCRGCARQCSFEAEDPTQDMQTCSERTAMLAQRVARLVALRRSPRAERRVALVLFNFPPNAGNVGTAAFLGVFESAFETLKRLAAEGYSVEVPASPDALRRAVLEGNAQRFGADANVLHRIPTDDHVRRERHLREIEATWGPAPGRQLSDGRSIFVLGARFGNVAVVVQPGMGHEGDPMRLLFERSFAPTHAFSAFYRWLREDFAAHAVLHFGTHGALEFMPGKQTGLSGDCWPERLLGALPNFYLYAANNPSEGTIAKRRSAATLLSYLTPPLANAGLYRGLTDLKSTLQRWRALPPEAAAEREPLTELLHSQAAQLDLASLQPPWTELPAERVAERVAQLQGALLEVEQTLIPEGLHVVGRALDVEQRREMLRAMAAGRPDAARLGDPSLQDMADVQAGRPRAGLEWAMLADRQLAEDTELAGIVRALDGRFVPPSPSGDLVTTPDILPTGRNLHGFDPFRLPSAFALREGERMAAKLLERVAVDGHGQPESVALVLWGTDNLKTEGAPIAQALALLGARPRHDSYGRLAGATLVPLAELGRPRIDVMLTISGIFRDLLPLQIKLLAEACWLAASADEPAERNFVRKHALAYMREQGCDLETAALRVFGNAEGAYGSNVNLMVDNGRWDDEDELAETYTRRKGFAYGRAGRPVQNAALLSSVLADVDLAYQNLESVELGVTTIDTYFDTLGGISRAMKRARKATGRSASPGGAEAPVYVADSTQGGASVRTLSEQVALETRTRMLNPKWYEGLLRHGFEGVRQIEAHVTNTMGWSATTGQVQPWVYQQLSETFVLDAAMRQRLASLNPAASAKLAGRLLEAQRREFWHPDPATLAALQAAGDELEDRLEGVVVPVPSASTKAAA